MTPFLPHLHRRPPRSGGQRIARRLQAAGHSNLLLRTLYSDDMADACVFLMGLSDER